MLCGRGKLRYRLDIVEICRSTCPEPPAPAWRGVWWVPGPEGKGRVGRLKLLSCIPQESPRGRGGGGSGGEGGKQQAGGTVFRSGARGARGGKPGAEPGAGSPVPSPGREARRRAGARRGAARRPELSQQRRWARRGGQAFTPSRGMRRLVGRTCRLLC